MVWYWYCYGCWNWRIGIAFKKSKYPFFISDLVEVQDPASGSDWVKDLVVDDGVDGEGHAVRGKDLLRRNLIHSSPGVNPPYLKIDNLIMKNIASLSIHSIFI